MYSVCILICVSMYQRINVSMYLYSYPSTHSISVLAAGSAWGQFKVLLKMPIEWTQRYTLRSWSSKFGDALGGPAGVNLEMHSEIVIRWVWSCTWRLCSCELGGRNRANLEIHLEAVDRMSLEMHFEAGIERIWRCTSRLWSSEIGGVLGGGWSGGGVTGIFRPNNQYNIY